MNPFKYITRYDIYKRKETISNLLFSIYLIIIILRICIYIEKHFNRIAIRKNIAVYIVYISIQFFPEII